MIIGSWGARKRILTFYLTLNHVQYMLEYIKKKLIKYSVIILFYFFQTEDYEEALQWYNYSLSLYTQTDTGDTNLAKLHRNRANCFIALKQNDKVRTIEHRNMGNLYFCILAKSLSN